MVYECISAKLADLKEMNRTTRKGDTDHLPGQPTGRVADAIPDLPVLLQLPLASEPDVRINNTGVG